MSWLARSFANSLRLDDEFDGDQQSDHHFHENDAASASPSPNHHQNADSSSEIQQEEALSRGVKEDLTEFKQTLSRQLWGVASFLAPPPPCNDESVSNLNLSPPSDRCQQGESSDSEGILGIGRDFGEIGGGFRAGVSGISKMASDYFPFGSEGNEGESDGGGDDLEEQELVTDEFDECEVGAVGITDEVLAFARNIAMHPETWLDFPLDEEEDLDDFDMSNDQREHALAIEQLAPRLAALRIELCPCHMTESYFWKVYFVLLHSRLSKQDAEILSTPQVMEARALWMKELHKQTKPEDDWFGRSVSFSNNNFNESHEEFDSGRTCHSEPATSRAADYKADKHPLENTEPQFIDKSVITEKPLVNGPPSVGPSKPFLPNYEEDDDDGWPDEEDSDLGSYKATMGNEEDISFSDLEDDTNYNIPIKSNILKKGTETPKS